MQCVTSVRSATTSSRECSISWDSQRPPRLSRGGSRHGTRSRSTLDVDQVEELGENAAVALYQILREATEQAVKRGAPSRIEIALRPTDGRGCRARRRRRRAARAPRGRVRGAGRPRGHAQRAVQLRGQLPARLDDPDRGAARGGAPLGSGRGFERSQRLPLLRLVACRVHAHRANRRPAAPGHRGRGRRPALPRDEDRAVAAPGRPAALRVPAARLRHQGGRQGEASLAPTPAAGSGRCARSRTRL